MDIFSRIDNHDQREQKQQTDTNSQQEFYLGIDGYKISEIEFHDDYRNNPQKYGCIMGAEIETKQNRFTQANTEKLYKLLSTPYKQYYSYDKHQKAVKRREKKVEKILKKGADPTYISARTWGLVVEDMSYSIRYMLTQYGFDMWGAIRNSNNYKTHLTENIYFCIQDKDFDSVEIFENISPMSLECIINTRKQLDISKQTVDELLKTAISTKDTNCFKNLELLFKYGQISLEKDQAGVLCEYLFEQDTFMQKKVPVLTSLCEQVQQTQPKTTKEVCAKYATQKNIKSSKTDNNKKSVIQEQIDKLFEDAQKSAS